jgi:hypothetical protein
VTALLVLVRDGKHGSPSVAHEQAFADKRDYADKQQVFGSATPADLREASTPPSASRTLDEISSSLTLHTPHRTSDQAFSSAVESLELCQTRARELAGQCYPEDGWGASALPDGTAASDATCLTRLRALHKELQQLQTDAGKPTASHMQQYYV